MLLLPPSEEVLVVLGCDRYAPMVVRFYGFTPVVTAQEEFKSGSKQKEIHIGMIARVEAKAAINTHREEIGRAHV